MEKDELLSNIADAVNSLYSEVEAMRKVKSQISSFINRDNCPEDIKEKGKNINARIDSIESQLIQVKQKTFQDVINFPNQLDGNLIHIQNYIDAALPPLSQGQKQRAEDVLELWKEKMKAISDLKTSAVKDLNEMISKAEIPFIQTEE